MKSSKKALIVCALAGECDQYTLSDYDLSIAVDAGAVWFRAHNYTPDFAVGDFDSIDADTFAWLEASNTHIKRVPCDKDYSDLELALSLCEEQQVQSATIVGALGERIDHQLCVLGALLRNSIPKLTLQSSSQALKLLRAGESITLKPARDRSDKASLESAGGITISNASSDTSGDTSSDDTGNSATFSVISPVAARVSITGARWELDRADLTPLSSRGLSNGRRPDCDTTVTVHSGLVFVVTL